MVNMMAELLGNSKKTIYRWKDENRPIIALIEKYFTKEDLEEFLETKEISKMKYLNHFQDILNIQFITFYRENFDTGENAEKFSKFFWDFISQYGDKLSSKKYTHFKHNKILLNELLLDYYASLVEENRSSDKYPEEYLKSTLSHFITVMQEPSIELINFIITNIEFDFKQIINYLRTNKLDPFAIRIEKELNK